MHRPHLGICHKEILPFHAEDNRFTAACASRDMARAIANELGSAVPRLQLTRNARCVMCDVVWGGASCFRKVPAGTRTRSKFLRDWMGAGWLMVCARITHRTWPRSRWDNGSARGVLGIEANGGDIHLANVVTGAVEHHENLVALHVAWFSCVTPLPPMNGAQKSQKHHRCWTQCR